MENVADFDSMMAVNARGTFLVLYVLIMLFGLFHLPRLAFLRCAALVFLSFAGLNAWEASQGRVADPRLAITQVSAVVVVVGCRLGGGRLNGGKVSAHGIVLKTLK